MRRANKTGTIYKLSGRRRKPWAASCTIGWEFDENRDSALQKRAFIGTFATRLEAERALDEYLLHPYDLANANLTFAEVYQRWYDEFYEENTKAARKYYFAYKYCQQLYQMPMKDIKVAHMQKVIRSSSAGQSTKVCMKSLFNKLFGYAMLHDIVSKDYSALFTVKQHNNITKGRKPFSAAELGTLLQLPSGPITDMLFFHLYTGMRPNEICELLIENANLPEWYIVGGSKTDAGRDRVVPIHPAIRPIFQRQIEKGGKYLFEFEGRKVNYDRYFKAFKALCAANGMNHCPHECRHTFIDRWVHLGLDKTMVKLIVGHQIRDVTAAVYTHYTVQDLHAELARFYYEGQKKPEV